MQIQQQIAINASADEVWKILGRGFDNVAEWASPVYTSQGHNTDAVLQNAPWSGRICETELGSIKETLTRYDEYGKSLSYNARFDNMPFFVKHLSNTWTVTSLNNSHPVHRRETTVRGSQAPDSVGQQRELNSRLRPQNSGDDPLPAGDLHSAGQSRVDMCLEVTILPVFNLVMGPMMRLRMGRVTKRAVEELKYFAENSVPHPRKREAQQKHSLNAA